MVCDIYVYYDDDGRILAYSAFQSFKNQVDTFKNVNVKIFPFEIMKKFYNGTDSITLYCIINNRLVHTTSQKNNQLKDSDVFCMAPWVGLHALPDGKLLPCCIISPAAEFNLGNIKTNSLKEAWNCDNMKTLRLNMLNEKKSKSCQRCYTIDKFGFGSMRKGMNNKFGEHYDKISDTLEDGTVKDMHLPYWDFRFSNICNFKCRSCGPLFSSGWFHDATKLYGRPPVPKSHANKLLEEITPFIESVEEIYFAGGEPLITPQHYTILEMLTELKRFDVRLSYNTNLSTLTLKDHNVLDYWKNFKSVTIGASLDGNYKRGEYLRKGQKWNETIANTKEIKKLPNVNFYINSTISIFNSFNITDFHREWYELGLISIDGVNLNMLLGPSFYRIDVLPKHLKEIVIERYYNHIEWINQQQYGKNSRIVGGFTALIKFVQDKDNSHELPSFVEWTTKKDELRNEKFTEVFPELKELFID